MRNKPTHQKRRPRKHPNWLIVIQVLKSVLKAILQSFCQEFSLSQTWKNAAAPVKPIPGTSHRPIRLSKAHLELLRSHQRPVPDPCATRRSTNKSSATILCLVLNVYIYTGWWLTYPSEKIWTSVGMMTFPIYGKKYSKPPTSRSHYKSYMLNTYWIYSMAISRNLNWRYLPYIRPI